MIFHNEYCCHSKQFFLLMSIALLFFFLNTAPFAQAGFNVQDVPALTVVLAKGTTRTLDDNIVSRLWNGDACVDSAQDYGQAVANELNNPAYNGAFDGWRVRQLTNYSGGHTAVVLDSPNGQSYYADNYFGHPEIQPMDKLSEHTYIMAQSDLPGNPNTSLGGFLFGGIPWEARDYGLDITVGETPDDSHPTDVPANGVPEGEEEHTVSVFEAVDPNAKFGPLGYGNQGYVRGDTPFTYTIAFENMATASAPANTVLVEDYLPSSLDYSSLRLGPVTIGNQTLVPPPGVKSFSGFIDLRPEINVVAAVKVTYSQGMPSMITWEFRSLDPDTDCGGGECEYALMDPINDLRGLLPPNNESPEGQGYVSYSIDPSSVTMSGDQIENHASITFDYNDPIQTAVWANTIDSTSPLSHIEALSAIQTSTTFTVEWAGSDENPQGTPGSGVQSYDVFVSEDGGLNYTQWLNDWTGTSADFPYGEDGVSYYFYSMAKDNVDNKQTAPADSVQTLVELEQSCDVQGDLDGDNDCDYDDYLIFRTCYGACNDDANYMLEADLDEDGCVTINDYRMFRSLL